MLSIIKGGGWYILSYFDIYHPLLWLCICLHTALVLHAPILRLWYESSPHLYYWIHRTWVQICLWPLLPSVTSVHMQEPVKTCSCVSVADTQTLDQKSGCAKLLKVSSHLFHCDVILMRFSQSFLSRFWVKGSTPSVRNLSKGTQSLKRSCCKYPCRRLS